MMNSAALAALGAALVLPALTATAAAADPPPKGVTIELANVSGSGCPAGTVAISVSDDADDFRVTLWGSGMRAEAGGNAPPAASRRSCQISMKAHVPQGYTYAVKRADYSGTAHLESGASATLKSQYYFQGMSAMPRTMTLRGPFSDAWRFVADDTAEPIYKSCGEERNLNVNTELRVDLGGSDPSKTNVIEMDDPAKTVYHLGWKRCP